MSKFESLVYLNLVWKLKMDLTDLDRFWRLRESFSLELDWLRKISF
jgi:hypothetical protein